MADSFLEQLERQKQLARESADEYEKGIALSKEIARLKAEKLKHQQTIVKNLESAREKVGTVDRVGSALGAFSPTDALHKLNQDLFTVQEQHKNWSNTLVNAHKTVVNFQKNYAKSVFNNLRTAATGEDYNKDFKRYSDIIYEQMGIKKKKGFQVADIAGLAGDMGTDLGNIVSPVKIAYQSFSSIGTQAVKIAARAPKIKTLIDTMGRNIDVFYDVSKAYSEKTLFQIKAATKEAVGSGDFTRLDALRKSRLESAGGMNAAKTPLDKLLVDMFPEQYGQTIKSGPHKITTLGEQNVLQKTFSPLIASVGKALEVTNQGYKWLMTWSPRFQTRNVAGATFQNVSEFSTKDILTGRFIKDFADSVKVVWNNGVDKQTGKITETWKAMMKAGEVGVEGIGGQSAAKLPRAIATFNENVQRYTSMLRETRYGKNMDQAIAKTSSVLYEYNQKYMTPFMKEVGKVVPFLAYNVGQFKYIPDALQRLASKYNFLTKLDKNTQDSFLKENPQLTPDYQKDQFMVGNIGNFGIQAEGFLRLFTGGIKDGMREAWGQLAPLFSGAIELATNWKVFEGKKLAEDTSTKKYQDSFILSTLAGDPFRTGEGNAYLKFAVEKFAGPLLSSIQKMFDSKSPWYSGFTSVRAYDNDPAGLRRIAGAEAAAEKQGGWFAALKERFGFGPGTANAAPLNVTIDSGDPVSKSASAEIQAWSKRNAGGRDVFGKEYVWGAGYEQTMFRQQTARWAAAEARNALNAGPDIGANFMQYSRVIIDDLLNDARWTGRQNDPEFKRIFDSTQQMLEWMRPRMRTEEGQFSSELLALYRRSMGKEATDIAFNKAQEDWVAFIGKTADMLRAAAGTSLESIIKTAQAEKLALGAQTGSGNVQYSDREIAARRYAIDAAAEEKIRKLEGRANVATSNILTAWANGTANELEKLNYLKEAAYKKFLGSDDYKSFVEDKVNGEQQFQAWRAAFEREWDYKISQQRVKEIESYLKQVKAMAEEEASAIVIALEDAFARGGVSIDKYFQTKIQTDTQASTATFGAIIDIFKSQLQNAPEAVTQLDILSTELTSAGTNFSKIKDIYQKLIEAMIAFKESGNIVELQQTLVAAINESTSLAKKVDKNTQDQLKAKADLDRAIAELKINLDKMRLETFQRTGGMRYPGENKFDAQTSPFGGTFEQIDANYALRKDQQQRNAASMFSNINQTMRGGFAADQELGESDAAYNARIDQILAVEKAREDITAESLAKIDAMERASLENKRTINAMEVEYQRELWDAKLSIASTMAGQLAQVAGAFYEASGKQSKEAFYVMKAAAIAEATVKGIQSVMAAFAAGTSVGGPAAIALGYAYAGMAAAFTGVQIGMLIAQTIAGPGKAEGGPIEGGSGTKDDVLFMGMGGEYVIKKSAVQKYGPSFMDALNKGLIPSDKLMFNIPMAPYPDYGKTHFNDGGQLIATNARGSDSHQSGEAPGGVTIMNIMDPREIDRYLASSAGQNAILNVLSSRQQAVRKVLS